MSMADAAENNLPPMHQHTDPGLRLSGDWARERAAYQAHIAACEQENTELKAKLAQVHEQWQQAEAHNNDVNADLARVRAWCQENARAARNRAAQTGDGDWLIRERVISEVWELVKPPVV